jgi:transposase-like protein
MPANDPQVEQMLDAFRRGCRPPDYEAVARRYDVTTRTVRRWVADGVNVGDPLAVAEHLARSKNPSRRAVIACIRELEKLTS